MLKRKCVWSIMIARGGVVTQTIDDTARNKSRMWTVIECDFLLAGVKSPNSHEKVLNVEIYKTNLF